MPTLIAEHQLTASNAKQFVTIPVERQMIKTITLIDTFEATNLSQTWALIGLMSGGTTTQNIIATLDAGYINKMSPLAWSGNLPVDPDTYVYGELYGASGQLYRLVVTLWKIITTPEGTFHVDS